MNTDRAQLQALSESPQHENIDIYVEAAKEFTKNKTGAIEAMNTHKAKPDTLIEKPAHTDSVCSHEKADNPMFANKRKFLLTLFAMPLMVFAGFVLPDSAITVVVSGIGSALAAFVAGNIFEHRAK